MKTKAMIPALLIAFCSLAPPPGAGRTGQEKWPADFGARAKTHIQAIVAVGPRRAGTPNEGRAAEYVAGQFRAMGVPVLVEPFDFESFECAVVELRIGVERLAPAGLGLDPYAGEPGYSGPFVILDPRAPSAWPPATAVAGKAVVTSEAGNPSLHFGIAALGPRCIVDLAPEDFDRVRGRNVRELTLAVQGGLVKRTSRNVIARLGAAPPAPQIVVGAHLDAYRDFPGANDNASGIAALLELCRRMKGLGIPEGTGLMFVAFGAEEAGVVGSRMFVARHAADLKHCRLTLVFDDLGGGGPIQVERDGGRPDLPQDSGAGLIPPAYRGRAWEGLGSPWRLVPPAALFAALGTSYHPAWLVDGINEAVKELGFDVRFTAMQGSDQMSFAQAGIATTGISAPNGRGHTQEDRPETVDIEKVRQSAETAARILQETWRRLPPSAREKPSRPDRDQASGEQARQAGPMAHVRFLASDELAGRLAGSPEGRIAARYIAERLRAAGVEPLPGAADYFQEVVWQTKEASPASPSGSSSPTLRAGNIIGYIRGRDPKRAGEFVLLAAHYDHLGTRTVDGVPTVFPGARDNAMGVAALLAAAESLALRPAARSILVLATTAEEEGLIGSRFFVEHPPVPLAQIVFVLNNDGAGEYDPGLWCLGGLETTTAGPLAEAAGRAHGLVTRPYPEKYRYLYAKGDAFSFAQAGIPALTVSPGFAEGEEERIAKYIHAPADRVDADFDAAYLLRFCLAYADLARAVADADTVPAMAGVGRSPTAPGEARPRR